MRSYAAPSAPRQPASARSATVPVGTVVAGRYLLQRIVGEGGMGCVYSAMSLADRRVVAIKFLHEEILRDPAAVARFLAEARAMVTIQSDHVVRVFEVGDGQSGRPPYIVMEYLEGEDLGALVDRDGALEVARACDYLLQCCVAVSEAHAVGVVHRDVKPSNFWLQQRASGPHLKLLDFGIAKAEGPSTDPRLTETTTTFGSPTYMSPEQVRSAKHVDLRADIWALGVVAFELISGKLPFDSPTTGGTLAAIIADEPAMLVSPHGPLPPELIEIVRLALTKDRAQRYPSVKAFAEQIARFATPLGWPALTHVRDVSVAKLGGESGEWSVDTALNRVRLMPVDLLSQSTFRGSTSNQVTLWAPRSGRTPTRVALLAIAAVTMLFSTIAVTLLLWARNKPAEPATASAALPTATTGRAEPTTSPTVVATVAPIVVVAAPSEQPTPALSGASAPAMPSHKAIHGKSPGAPAHAPPHPTAPKIPTAKASTARPEPSGAYRR